MSLRHVTFSRSEKRRTSLAVVTVLSVSLSVRAAAAHYRVVNSTLKDYFNQEEPPLTAARKTAFNSIEKFVRNLLLKYAGMGVILTSRHIFDAVQLFVRLQQPVIKVRQPSKESNRAEVCQPVPALPRR